MMPVDWPLAAKAAVHPHDPARPRSGRGRLSAARADFFLDPDHRLSDEERALMGAMAKSLVGEIADELLAALPPLLAARAEREREGVYAGLVSSRLIDSEVLVRLLLRRSDEQRHSASLSPKGATLLSSLVSDPDAAIADAAMALTIARGQRTDRFGRMGIGFDDLPAEEAVSMVHAVAAVLRRALDSDSDLVLADSARDLLARHDEGRRVEALVEALARALDGAGRATDDKARHIADSRDSALLVALLARRGGIGFDDAWDMFMGGDAMVLARIAQCDRSTAAQIIAVFDRLPGAGSPERDIERFDQLSETDVDRYRSWLRLDPNYRKACEQAEQDRG